MMILHIKCLLVKRQKLSTWIKKAWPKLTLLIGLMLTAGKLAQEGSTFCPNMRTWGQIPRTQDKVMHYSICIWDPYPNGKRQDSGGKIWEPMGYPGMYKVESLSQSLVERQTDAQGYYSLVSHMRTYTHKHTQRSVFSFKKRHKCKNKF